MRTRPYTFLELTNSICSRCLAKVEAKVVQRDGRIYMLKHCSRHGAEEVLIATDADYYRRARSIERPSEMPLRFNTKIQHGCPYDCGLCPDHEQHSCLAIVEVTDRCNLTCPICYADSSPARSPHRSLEQIESMFDAIVANEGHPSIVQISGGEPAMHPEFFAILDAARQRPIQHLMLNTNGVKIGEDRDFVERLATYKQGFEVYLQFDSLHTSSLEELRGVDLRDVRRAAIDHLNEFGISTNLVVVVKKGLNDGELGEIVEYALEQPCVRGVTFQPIQIAGRVANFEPAKHRLTLTEVRDNLLEQSDVFSSEDVIPVPCHPDCVAMAYALKVDGDVHPLTRYVDLDQLAGAAGATISFERSDALRDHMIRLFSAANSPESGQVHLQNLLCCLPQVQLLDGLTYENVFRVTIMKFMDCYDLDVRSVKKACVHFVHPNDNRIIPFDTYNIFYREGCEETWRDVVGANEL